MFGKRGKGKRVGIETGLGQRQGGVWNSVEGSDDLGMRWGKRLRDGGSIRVQLRLAFNLRAQKAVASCR